ncbi:MAG: DUF4129 domain-containing protein [Ornithinimicrobium sp.]
MSTDPARPGEQEGRRLLTEELSKPEYNRPEDFIARLRDWLFEQLDNVLQVLPGSSGLSAILVAVVVAIAVAVAVYALRRRLRTSALTQGTGGSVLEGAHLRARDYRARAQEAARVGDWDTVLLDSYRALTASAGERTVLDDAPTRTAFEVAVGLAPAFPERADDLLQAAAGFDRVRYGEQACTREEASAVRELDQSVLRTRPQTSWTNA